MIGGDGVEDAAFARVTAVEGAFIKLDAFAETLDETEPVMVHGGFHHGQDMIRVGVGGASHESRTGRNGLFHRVDRIIHRPPLIGFAFESKRGRGGSLFFGQAINPIVHDHIGHLDVFPRRVIKVVASDGKGIAVPAENEHVQVRPRQGNAAGERQGASMDIMSAMSLHEIRKTTGATDARHRRDLLMPQLAFLDQFEVESEHGEISAARTPSGMVGGEFLFGEPFSFFDRTDDGRGTGRGHRFRNTGATGGDFGGWTADAHDMRESYRLWFKGKKSEKISVCSDRRRPSRGPGKECPEPSKSAHRSW
jgi:hypothetical protein